MESIGFGEIDQVNSKKKNKEKKNKLNLPPDVEKDRKDRKDRFETVDVERDGPMVDAFGRGIWFKYHWKPFNGFAKM